MKYTQYFLAMKQRPDRQAVTTESIEQVIADPVREHIQNDGRIRRGAAIEQAEGRYLRVIFLEDGVTVHSAFFDRPFKP